jgi:DNA replication protein DnaC
MAVIAGSLEETEAIRAAVGTRDMLVLSGAPGCGKTVAAALWATEDVRKDECWEYTDHLGNVYGHTGNRFKGQVVVWVTAAKLARWERYDQDEMAKLLKVGKLVIDDLGGEYLDKGGFYASLLDELINERQAGSRPTILTTNLDAAGFSTRYGERIVDRIREGGRFFACGNASLRRKPSP